MHCLYKYEKCIGTKIYILCPPQLVAGGHKFVPVLRVGMFVRLHIWILHNNLSSPLRNRLKFIHKMKGRQSLISYFTNISVLFTLDGSGGYLCPMGTFHFSSFNFFFTQAVFIFVLKTSPVIIYPY